MAECTKCGKPGRYQRRDNGLIYCPECAFNFTWHDQDWMIDLEEENQK